MLIWDKYSVLLHFMFRSFFSPTVICICLQQRGVNKRGSDGIFRSFWWPHTYGTPHLLLCKERSPSKLQLQLL